MTILLGQIILIFMTSMNIHQAKANLSKLIEGALSGEEIIITRRNKPLVKIVPLAPSATHRKIGSAKGQMAITGDFDAIPPGFEEYL